jgi:hypothetical protein
MQVSEWNTVQSDPSPYSQYWETPNAFEPQTFSQNAQATQSWNNVCCNVVFWMNFIATVAIIIWVAARYVNDRNNSTRRAALADEPLDGKPVISVVVGGSAGLGIGVNILHFLYATLLPFFYIKFGCLAGIVLSFAFAILPIYLGFYWFLIFPIIMIPIWLCFYCCMHSYFELSAAVLKITTQLICKYPSLSLLVFIQADYLSECLMEKRQNTSDYDEALGDRGSPVHGAVSAAAVGGFASPADGRRLRARTTAGRRGKEAAPTRRGAAHEMRRMNRELKRLFTPYKVM